MTTILHYFSENQLNKLSTVRLNEHASDNLATDQCKHQRPVVLI